MMKKYILMGLFVLGGFSFVGCNEWLDVPSKTEVIDYEMFETEQGFMDAMAGTYSLMAGNELYGDVLTLSFLDMLACRYDVTNHTIGGLSTDLGLPTYYENQNVISVVDEIWRKGYNVIANINSLLEQIDDYRDVFTYDNYNLIKGEALGLRAFMHFDLMRMFGKQYDAAGTELTTPYVTQLSGRDWPLFRTEDEIMDLALEDLRQADSLLQADDLRTSSIENSWINDRRQHFNRWAVYATMARIYHWRGDKENALLYAQKVIESGQFEFVDPSTFSSNSRDVAFSTEVIFSLYKDDLDDLYEDRIGTASTQTALYNQVGDIESVYEVNSGGSTDYRFSWLWYLYEDPNSEVMSYKYYRYYGTIAMPESRNLVTLMRLSEMYYIAAECCGNTEEGRSYLNMIRENRGLRTLNDNITDEDFSTELFKEYQKEFFMEGQLFYYYKRKGQTLILDHDNVSYVDMAQTGWVFPIPQTELDLRDALEEIMTK